MKAFDWHRMALDKVPVDFLAEVALRSVYTFVLVFIFLKITGRRGVRQMSLFEVLIILTLGSAAGMSLSMTMSRCCRCWWFCHSGAALPADYVADGQKRDAGEPA